MLFGGIRMVPGSALVEGGFEQTGVVFARKAQDMLCRILFHGSIMTENQPRKGMYVPACGGRCRCGTWSVLKMLINPSIV